MALMEQEIKEIVKTNFQEPEVRLGQPITEEELMRLPKDGPSNPTLAKYERVDGRLREVPTTFVHDAICLNLILLMGPAMRGRGAGTTGQAGFRMKDGNIRVPDVSFTRKARLPGGKAPNTFGDVAPDLCVEIISPSERQDDMDYKVRDYFSTGTVFVWHVFPERQQVTVFTSPTEINTYGPDDTLEVGDLLPGFSCLVSDLFAME